MAEPTTNKPRPPALKDWRDQVENKIKQGGNEKKDVLEVIWLGQELLAEMGPPNQWLSEQGQYLNAIISEYIRIYVTRFGEEPPRRTRREAVQEILIDIPERRKQVVRDIALSMTKVGDSISYEGILKELKQRGMKLVANNPNATISTILHGFKPQFSKVEGKRGMFQRRE